MKLIIYTKNTSTIPEELTTNFEVTVANPDFFSVTPPRGSYDYFYVDSLNEDVIRETFESEHPYIREYTLGADISENVDWNEESAIIDALDSGDVIDNSFTLPSTMSDAHLQESNGMVDLSFRVQSTSDGNEVILFPVEFSTIPWDIQISYSGSSTSAGGYIGLIDDATTTTSFSVNRLNAIDNDDDPHFNVRVRVKGTYTNL